MKKVLLREERGKSKVMFGKERDSAYVSVFIFTVYVEGSRYIEARTKKRGAEMGERKESKAKNSMGREQ
jgi:hypothetical protein